MYGIQSDSGHFEKRMVMNEKTPAEYGSRGLAAWLLSFSLIIGGMG